MVCVPRQLLFCPVIDCRYRKFYNNTLIFGGTITGIVESYFSCRAQTCEPTDWELFEVYVKAQETLSNMYKRKKYFLRNFFLLKNENIHVRMCHVLHNTYIFIQCNCITYSSRFVDVLQFSFIMYGLTLVADPSRCAFK